MESPSLCSQSLRVKQRYPQARLLGCWAARCQPDGEGVSGQQDERGFWGQASEAESQLPVLPASLGSSLLGKGVPGPQINKTCIILMLTLYCYSHLLPQPLTLNSLDNLARSLSFPLSPNLPSVHEHGGQFIYLNTQRQRGEKQHIYICDIYNILTPPTTECDPNGTLKLNKSNQPPLDVVGQKEQGGDWRRAVISFFLSPDVQLQQANTHVMHEFVYKLHTKLSGTAVCQVLCISHLI